MKWERICVWWYCIYLQYCCTLLWKYLVRATHCRGVMELSKALSINTWAILTSFPKEEVMPWWLLLPNHVGLFLDRKLARDYQFSTRAKRQGWIGIFASRQRQPLSGDGRYPDIQDGKFEMHQPAARTIASETRSFHAKCSNNVAQPSQISISEIRVIRRVTSRYITKH